MKTALVAGASGVVGRALIEHLDGLDDWQAIGISRRPPDFDHGARFLSVDLADRAGLRAALAPVAGEITHLFYTAYVPGPDIATEARINTAMLVNLVEEIEALGAPRLGHVQITQGSKWYGNHLGPYRTPAREDDPGHLPPNFYFDQQEWIAARGKSRGWRWSAIRPHGICGLAIGSAMNQLTAIALYATICRHLGRELRFPGKPGFYRAVYQMTEAAYLARGMVWAAGAEGCADRAINFTNGDFLRWENLWPKVARFFDMEMGPVQTIALTTFMSDKEPVWAEIRRRHGLRDYTLAQLTNWKFADFVFGCEYDQMSDMTRARNAGWQGANDSEAMYLRLLAGLRGQRIIP